MDESFKGFVASWEFEGILQPFSYNLALEPLELWIVRTMIKFQIIQNIIRVLTPHTCFVAVALSLRPWSSSWVEKKILASK